MMDQQRIERRAAAIRRESRRITENIQAGDSNGALRALNRITNIVQALEREIKGYDKPIAVQNIPPRDPLTILPWFREKE